MATQAKTTVVPITKGPRSLPIPLLRIAVDPPSLKACRSPAGLGLTARNAAHAGDLENTAQVT